MTELFLEVLNRSISAGWLILAVVVLRFVLRKAPGWSHVLLWGIVALRLVCPISVESSLSLLPSARTISEETGAGSGITVHTGFALVDDRVNEYLAEQEVRVPEPEKAGVDAVAVLAVLWVSGVAALVLYSLLRYGALYRRVSMAVMVRENIFRSERVSSPVVLGMLGPKIYLPTRLSEEELTYVVAHEQAHIRRGDHWWKPLGFLLLAVYWFHPLMWLAYVLLCRDIELACDERVVRELDREQRADYSQALLACSTGRRSVAACPLSFGEVGVKERVRAVLNYKKPAFWIVAAAVTACGAAAVCFLTNPAGQEDVSQQPLSLEQVVELARKGEALTWEDFDGFRHYETGSGLYIRVYEIDEKFTLKIGGGEVGPKASPMYIYLEADTGVSDYIDIRQEDVAAFISRHQGDTVLAEALDTVIWWLDADLDRDGEAEGFRVRETAEQELYELEVLGKNETVLWSEEAGIPHIGWSAILLYEENGQDYLIRYQPAMYQGFGSYTCTRFALEGGQPSEVETWSVDFDLSVGQKTDEMKAFEEAVNGMLENATVLLSTLEGRLVAEPKPAAEVPQLYPVDFGLE